MVRVVMALCALSVCACGEEERLQAVAPPARQASTEPPAPTPASPYSIAQPIAAMPHVAMPSDSPRVIPREWLTADPSPLYIFRNDTASSTPQSVTLTNRGGGNITVSVKLNGSGTLALAAAVDAVMLAPGQSLQVSVVFSPTDHEKAGALLAVSDSAGTAFSIPVAAELLRN